MTGPPEREITNGANVIEGEGLEANAKAFLDLWTGQSLLPPEMKNVRNINEYLSTSRMAQGNWESLIHTTVDRMTAGSKQMEKLLRSTSLSPYAKEVLRQQLTRAQIAYLTPSMVLPKQVLGFDENYPNGLFDPNVDLRLIEYRLFFLSKIQAIGLHDSVRSFNREEGWKEWQDYLLDRYGKKDFVNFSRIIVGGIGNPDILPPREKVLLPIHARFYKLGGTWDMVEKEGRFSGTGNLDDAELDRLEQSVGLRNKMPARRIARVEKRLANILYRRMKATIPEPVDLGEHLSWAKEDQPYLAEGGQIGHRDIPIGRFIKGEFIPLYSGDSSHLRPSLIAPIVSILIEEAIENPNSPIVGAQGTDTADIAILSILDALVFDTELPAFIFTGANRSHREENSDAPANFMELAKLAGYDIRKINQYPIGEFDYNYSSASSGAFWIFHNNIYPAPDLNKLDPGETREIEGTSTFFSPHALAVNTRFFLSGRSFWHEFFKTLWFRTSKAPPPEHVTRHMSMENLFDALNSIHTISLDDQNPVWEEIKPLRDPKVRAVVIATHGLGNTNNIIRQAAVEAAKEGKIVIDVSRSLIGEVNTRYAGSLLDANTNELQGTNTMILSPSKLSKTAARAIAARALLEGLDQQQTQDLINRYCQARKLL